MIETVLPMELTVTLEAGVTEPVKLRQIRVKEFRAAQSAMLGDEAKLVEICCDKPAGWAETLTPDSFNVLAIDARRINAAFFAWCERTLADQLRLMPEGLLEKAMNQSLAASKPTSPTPRPRPA